MLRVGTVSWTYFPPRFRAIARDNRFNSHCWIANALSGKLETSVKGDKPVLRVFVSGKLKPPATNRGVGPRKAMRFRCANCENVGVLVYEQGGLPLKPFYCHICDPRLAGR